MYIYAIIIFFEPIFMEILNFFFSRHPFCGGNKKLEIPSYTTCKPCT